MIFNDRIHAAKLLAKLLEDYISKNKLRNVIILAIPRGGLQIGLVLAKQLEIELSIVITKKLSHPGNEELAIGAVGPNNTLVIDSSLISVYNVPERYINQKTKELNLVIKEKYKRYTGKSMPSGLKGKAVIIVDDGIATGHTMLAAVRSVKSLGAKKVIVSSPVCSLEAKYLLSKEAELVCYDYPEFFYAIGQFYKEFPQLTDDEAILLLKGVKMR